MKTVPEQPKGTRRRERPDGRPEAAAVCAAAFLALAPFPAPAEEDPQVQPYAGVEAWAADREERLAWFREARFGLLIHLGLYSGAEGVWPPGSGARRDERRHPEWTRTWSGAGAEEYESTLKPLFRPAPGCTEEWAELAKAAGTRYVVFSAKSEEGYTPFQTETGDPPGDSNISPAGRDLLGEFVASVRKQQLMPGVYYSLVDWRSGSGEDYPAYLQAQFRELATRYGPLGILWADGSTATAEGSRWNTKALLEIWREYQPASVVNNRFWNGLENPCGDFTTPQDYVPPASTGGLMFEVRQSLGEHTGYHGEDVPWKSPREILLLLSDVASKGGNLLLGVGPDANGRIPRRAAASLTAAGNWLATHGEAIYATGPSPLLAPAFEGRCTLAERGGEHILYCHLHEWPQGGTISLNGLSTRCLSATLLGKSPLELEVSNVSWPAIRIPDSPPDPDNPLPVIAARLEGKPVIDPIPYPLQGVDRTVTLTASQAILVPGPGNKNGLRLEDRHIGFWSHEADSLWFPVMMNHPGKFRVVLEAAVARPCGGEAEIRVLDQALRVEIEPTADHWTDFRELEAGIVDLRQTGLLAIHIRPLRIDGYGLMNLRGVRLLPVDVGD